MFVKGGFTSQFNESVGNLNDSEIIDLDIGTLNCPPPADLPFGNDFGFILRTQNEHPLVCGGDSNPRSCLEYIPENRSWVEGPSTLENRARAIPTELPNGSFWILGNYLEERISELYIDGAFVEGPSLEDITVSTDMCATPISEQLTFVGDFDFQVHGAFCGTYVAVDGSKQLVVARGRGIRKDRTTILDVETRTWREGPSLPMQLYSGETWQIREKIHSSSLVALRIRLLSTLWTP